MSHISLNNGSTSMSSQSSTPVRAPQRPPRAPRMGQTGVKTSPSTSPTLRSRAEISPRSSEVSPQTLKEQADAAAMATPSTSAQKQDEANMALPPSHVRTSAFDERRRGYFVSPPHAKLYPSNDEPSFTFVCLGVGGGPIEGDCSCYIMKPAQRKWDEGSIVVEGGSWLGALSRVCEDEGPTSAFCDVEFPFDVPALRAGYLGSFAHSFLLSHAHLDHILGMVLGSASLPGKRKVYGLKSSLENLMGVFNGKVWPKLATWGDGPGPAVYQLYPVEPQAKLRVDDTLSVIPFALSHGLNPSEPPAPPTPASVFNPRYSVSKRLSLPLNGYFPDTPGQQGERPVWNGEKPVFTSPFAPESGTVSLLAKRASVLSVAAEETSSSDTSPRASVASAFSSGPKSEAPSAAAAAPKSANRGHGYAATGKSTVLPRVRRPRTAQGSEKEEGFLDSRAASVAGIAPTDDRGRVVRPNQVPSDNELAALDSTAFFITNEATGKDVLFFGDVEPDSVSQKPRNGRIWAHAARQFAAGKLNAVFLECSFPASHPTEFLYGHLSVAHVFDELRVMATGVVAERKRMSARQRRRQQQEQQTMGASYASVNGFGSHADSRGSFRMPEVPTIPALNTSESTITEQELSESLRGLSVIIIHVKTALFPSFEANLAAAAAAKAQAGDGGESTASTPPAVMDPRSMRDRIYDELNEAEEQHGYGVRFVMAQQGLRIEC